MRRPSFEVILTVGAAVALAWRCWRGRHPEAKRRMEFCARCGGPYDKERRERFVGKAEGLDKRARIAERLMCDVDYEGEDIVSASRKARKEHACFACRETIRPGERYHYAAQTYDGAFSAFKHCLRCWALIRAILRAGTGSVQWDLNCGVSWQEAFDEEPPEHVAALAFMTPAEAQARLDAEEL